MRSLSFIMLPVTHRQKRSLCETPHRTRCRRDTLPRYAVLLVDEYQDFNQLEVSFIDSLTAHTPTIIAGDDDQALYLVRSSSSRHIRERYAEGDYQAFELPFCMRCTEPIVDAVRDIVAEAQRRGYLRNRIPKPYVYYPPTKGEETARYPAIQLVEVSAQSLRVNYFGRYIEQQLQLIPEADVIASFRGGFPTVLIIGPSQYLRQVHQHLNARGCQCIFEEHDDPTQVVGDYGLRLLREQPQSNLGWRIVLATDAPPCADAVVRTSHEGNRPLCDLLPRDYREEVLRRANELAEEAPCVEPAVDAEPGITIRMASFEGSKGLSAHHVFIIGLQDGDRGGAGFLNSKSPLRK